MKYRQPLDYSENIFSSSVGLGLQSVVYIIVIYRQPCVLHISWYTVHHPSGGGEFTVLGQGGYKCFQGVNIPPYGVAA